MNATTIHHTVSRGGAGGKIRDDPMLGEAEIPRLPRILKEARVGGELVWGESGWERHILGDHARHRRCDRDGEEDGCHAECHDHAGAGDACCRPRSLPPRLFFFFSSYLGRNQPRFVMLSESVGRGFSLPD